MCACITFLPIRSQSQLFSLGESGQRENISTQSIIWTIQENKPRQPIGQLLHHDPLRLSSPSKYLSDVAYVDLPNVFDAVTAEVKYCSFASSSPMRTTPITFLSSNVGNIVIRTIMTRTTCPKVRVNSPARS